MALALSTQYNVPGSQTFANLLTNQPASGVAIGTQAVTTDQGLFYSNGTTWIPVGRCAILSQTAIPFIVPPTGGSISAAGALSGITLNKTYGSCYMYFPANAVAASSTAGFYYVVMSSTTAGTVYLNQYTSGQPTIPASPTAVTAGQLTYTTPTTAVIALTIPVPPNAMGANGEIEVDYVMIGTSNGDTKTATVGYGVSGGTITTVQTSAISTAGTSDTGVLFRIRNAGVTNAQWSITTPTGDPAQAAATALTGSTIDSTVTENIVFSLQLGTASDYVAIVSHSVKLFPN
jgi:hypothetical protein